MSTHEYQLLIRHEMWANQRIAQAVLNLEEMPNKVSILMNHVIGAQHVWISRINGVVPTIGVFPQLDQDTWYEQIVQHESALLKIASSDQNLKRSISYQNTSGQSFQNPVSELLLHLAMHSQYHRGQIVAYSRDLLDVVPSTDMIAFLRLV